MVELFDAENTQILIAVKTLRKLIDLLEQRELYLYDPRTLVYTKGPTIQNIS